MRLVSYAAKDGAPRLGALTQDGVVDLYAAARELGVAREASKTAGPMLGRDKSRGYCLEMICADFLAGANIDGTNPEALVLSLQRVYELLSWEQQNQFLQEITSTSCRD
jgi:hypothetical protein